jgi:O-antigen ligase
MDSRIILLIPVSLILLSLIFFSRGILIFFTLLCLEVTAVSFGGISQIALKLRWVFFALFCFHVFGDILLGRTVRRVKYFDIAALIFIIYAFISATYSPYPYLTLQRATTILALYISVFWIIWKYTYYQGPRKVISLILSVMWLIFALGYLMIFISPARAFLAGRFAGIFGNPNGVGVISAIILPLSLWQFLETKKKSSLLLFLMILVALLLSAARGSINATIIALGYFLYARSRQSRPLVLFSSISFILIFTWIVDTALKEFFKVYIRAESIPMLGGRLEIWPVALNFIFDKPLFGYGFGVEDKMLVLKHIVLYRHSGLYMHNAYLGMLVQLGLTGFIIFFIPLFILLFKEVSLKDSGETIPLLRYALRASLIAGLLCGIFESWIYSVGNSQVFPFWIIVMLLVFYRCRDKEESTA